MQSYRNGLAQLPERRSPPPPPLQQPPPATDEEGETHPTEGEANRSSAEADHQTESTAHSNVVESPLDGECAKARSVLNANIAACHVKLASVRRSRLRFECRTEFDDSLIYRVKTRMPLKRALKVRHGHCRHERISRAHTQLCRTIPHMSERYNDGHNAMRR